MHDFLREKAANYSKKCGGKSLCVGDKRWIFFWRKKNFFSRKDFTFTDHRGLIDFGNVHAPLKVFSPFLLLKIYIVNTK